MVDSELFERIEEGLENLGEDVAEAFDDNIIKGHKYIMSYFNQENGLTTTIVVERK